VDDARIQPVDDESESQNWKRDDIVARILRRWRELTGDKLTRDGDRRTLVACSGGADSIALAFALSRISGSSVIAHIRHDIRSEEETDADRELVRFRAEQWGVEFVSRDIRVKSLPGNLEANARSGRYSVLQDLAEEHDCPYIATGHHADDQLETLLMHLMRGSGLRGMTGMRAKTQLERSTLVRPMLDIPRDEIVQMLRRAAITWRDDPTNQDHAYFRNRIRHDVVPMMRSVCPSIAARASDWTNDLMSIRAMMDEMIDKAIGDASSTPDGMIWDRRVFRSFPEPVLGMLPNRVCRLLCANQGQDLISRETINAWIRGVKSFSTEPTQHRIGPMVCFIDAHRVRIAPVSDVEQDGTEAQYES